MEKNEKKCQVHLIESSNKSPIAKWKDGNKYLSLTTNSRNWEIDTTKETYQHLYITSDDEIKEKDYVYVACSEVEVEEIRQVTGYYNGQFLFDDKSQIDIEYCKKVIATTDKSLHNPVAYSDNQISSWQHLPQPSESFIQKYIESYNKGEKIEDVLVEYECKSTKVYDNCGGHPGGHWEEEFIPKVNSKDNTITIRKIKDSWNRKEVEILLRNSTNNIIDELLMNDHSIASEYYIDITEDFIKNNL